MKLFLLVLAVSGVFAGVFALETPYLISVTPVNDTSADLSWRNNSAAYTGIIILRKTGGDAFNAIAGVEGSRSSYLDVSLSPATSYTYALLAIAGADTGDTSNSVTATPFIRLCNATFESWTTERGDAMSVWPVWDNTSKRVVFTYRDKLCDESGVIIFRSDGDSVYTAMDTVFHADPFDMSLNTLNDPTCGSNRVYNYRFALFRDTLLLMREGGTIFTYDPEALFITDRYRISTVNKLSEFPAYYSNPGSWAMKTGDTLLLKESNTDSLTYTMLAVGDPGHPTFTGYRHSGPVVAAGSDCYTDRNRLFVYSGGDSGSLIYYAYDNGEFAPKDTLEGQVAGVVGKLDDSTLLTGLDYIRAVTIDDNGYDSACVVLHVPQSSPGSIGIVNHHRIMGLIDGMLFLEHTTTGTSKVPTEYEVLTFSDCLNYPARISLEDAIPLFPAMIGDYITKDSALADAAHVLLDTLQRHAYVFGRDSIMRIYSYKLDQADITDLHVAVAHDRPENNGGSEQRPPAMNSGPRDVSFPAFACIYDMTGRLVYEGNIGSRTDLRRLSTRMRHGIYAVSIGKNRSASAGKTVFTLNNY